MSLQNSKFSHKNESFTCVNCLKQVLPRKKSCRNHCPFCLHSLHVDINPGDRNNPCKGLLIPQEYEPNTSKGLMIIFKCKSCGQTTKNQAALEDEIQPDDYDAILRLISPTCQSN